MSTNTLPNLPSLSLTNSTGTAPVNVAPPASLTIPSSCSSSDTFRTFTQLALAPADGAEDPDLGADALIVRTDSPQWTNEQLLSDTLKRSEGLPQHQQEQWLNLLFEYCIAHNPQVPERLELAQHLIDQQLCHPISTSRACSLGSVVHLAAETGSLEALNYALHIDPSGAFLTTGNFGQTPLHCAAIRDDSIAPQIIQRLCQLGVNPNALDKDGRSPLSRSSNPLCAQALLNCGAFPDLVDMHGTRALGIFLYYAAIDTVKILIQAGANIHDYQTINLSQLTPAPRLPQRTAFGIYALGIDRQYEHPFALELFLLGANPFLKDPDGFCPFEHLHPSAQAAIEKHILQQGTQTPPSLSLGKAKTL